jgi:hypothetical protein
VGLEAEAHGSVLAEVYQAARTGCQSEKGQAEACSHPWCAEEETMVDREWERTLQHAHGVPRGTLFKMPCSPYSAKVLRRMKLLAMPFVVLGGRMRG